MLAADPTQRVVLLIEELGALPKPSRFALANALRAHENGQALDDALLNQAALDLITAGDPIVGHLQKVMIEHNLFSAAQTALTEKLRFNRHDEALARLELAGFLRPENGFWQVRNRLYAQLAQSKNHANGQAHEMPSNQNVTIHQGGIYILGNVSDSTLIDGDHNLVKNNNNPQDQLL